MLKNAFLKTAKSKQFMKTQALGTRDEIDQIRAKYLLKVSRRTEVLS